MRDEKEFSRRLDDILKKGSTSKKPPPKWRLELPPKAKEDAYIIAQEISDAREGFPTALWGTFEYDNPRKVDQLKELFLRCQNAAKLCPTLNRDFELELYALFKQVQQPVHGPTSRVGGCHASARHWRHLSLSPGCHSCTSQGTLGPPKTPKPSELDPIALARWSALYRVSGMTLHQARLSYIDAVLNLYLSAPPVARHPMRTVHHAVHRPYDTHGACLASQRGASHPGGVCDTDGQPSGARRAARLTTRGSLRPPTLLRRRLEAAAEGLQRESQ